jgi:polyhydroxyalkanoate synthase
MVPPTINKFYIADLAPAQHRRALPVRRPAGLHDLVAQPDERHAGLGPRHLRPGGHRRDGRRRGGHGHERVALQAFCSGGIITAMVLAHLAETGRQDRVSAVSFAVTVLDWARAGTVSALMDEESVKAATEKSRKKGYLDGAQLAEVFAWLRPNDLVWNYWVNNYLQGKPPPNFDILFWNADTTRMSAGLHRDFIDIAIGNALVEPAKATMLGTRSTSRR